MKRGWGIVAALVAAGGIAACGGDESDEAEVRAVVEHWKTASSDGDGEEVCATLTAESITLVESVARQVGGAARCETIFSTKNDEDWIVGDITVSDDSAVVQQEPEGSAERNAAPTSELAVREIEGHWRVNLSGSLGLAGQAIQTVRKPRIDAGLDRNREDQLRQRSNVISARCTSRREAIDSAWSLHPTLDLYSQPIQVCTAGLRSGHIFDFFQVREMPTQTERREGVRSRLVWTRVLR